MIRVYNSSNSYQVLGLVGRELSLKPKCVLCLKQDLDQIRYCSGGVVISEIKENIKIKSKNKIYDHSIKREIKEDKGE